MHLCPHSLSNWTNEVSIQEEYQTEASTHTSCLHKSISRLFPYFFLVLQMYPLLFAQFFHFDGATGHAIKLNFLTLHRRDHIYDLPTRFPILMMVDFYTVTHGKLHLCTLFHPMHPVRELIELQVLS